MNDQNPEDDAQNHISVKDLKSRFEANKKANKQPEFVPGKNAAHTGEKKLANATWIKNKQEKEEQEEEAQRSTQESQQQAEKPKEDHGESDVKNRIARFNQLSKKEDTFEDLRHRKELAKAKALSKQKDGYHEEGHETGEHNEHQEHQEHHDNNEDEESRANRVPSEKVAQFDTHVKDKIQFFSKTKVEEHQTHIPKWRVGPSGEQIAVDEHGNDVVDHHHNDKHNEEHGEEVPGANVQEKIKIYSHDGVELEEEHHREKVEPQPGDENGRNHEDETIAEGIVQEKVEYFSKRTPEEEELERRRERGELDHAEGHERGTNEGDEETRENQNLEAHYVENSENNENPNKVVEGQNFVEKEQVDELQDVDVQEKIDLYSRTAAPNELPEKKNRSKKQNEEGQNADEEEEIVSGNNEGEEKVEEKVTEVEQITVENYQSQEAVVIESQGNQEDQIETVVTEENHQTEKGDVKEKIKAFSHENKEQTQPKKKNNKKNKKAENAVERNEELEKEEEKVVEELEKQVQEAEAEVREQEQQLQEEQTVVENNEIAQGNTQDKIKMFSQQGNQETYQPKKKHNKKRNQEGERKNSTQSRENEDAAAVEEEAEIQQIEEQRAYNEVQEVINEAERVEAEARKQEELQLKQQEQAVEREIEEAEEEIKRIEKSEIEKGDVQGKIKMFSNNENKETYQPKKHHNKKKNQKESEGASGENVQVEEGEILAENEEEVENYASEEQGKTEQNEGADNQENIETENVEENNQEIAGIEKGSVRQKAGLYSHEKKEDTFTGGRKHHEGKTKNTETETNEDVNIETTEEVIVEQNAAEAEENAEENKEIEAAESKGNKKKNKKKQNKNKNKQNIDEKNQDLEDGQVVSDEVVPEEPSNEPETIIEETNEPESNVKKIIESGVFAHQPTHHHHLHHETAPHQTEEVSVAVEENNVENPATEQQEQPKEEEIVQNIPQETLAQEIVEIVKEEEQPAVQEKREDVSEAQSNEQAVEYHSHHHHHHQQSVETIQVEVQEQEKLTEEVQVHTQETQEQHTSSQQNYTEVYSEPTYTSTYIAEAKVVEESQPVQSAQVNQSYASSQEGLNARFVVEETRENVTSEPQVASEWKSRESHSEENEIVISREAPVADKPKAHIQRNAAVYREQEAYQDTTTSAHHTHHETYNITVTQQSNQQVSGNYQSNQQGSTVHGQNAYFAAQPQSPSTFAELDKSAGFAGNTSQTLYENQRESYSTLGQNPQYNQSNRPSENSFGQFGTSGVKFSIPENKNNRLPTFPPMVDDSINEDLKSDKSRLLEVNTISDHESKVMSENASAHRNSGPGNRGLGSNANTFVEGDNTSHVHIIQPVQVKRESVVQEKPVSKRPTTIEQVPLNQSQQQQEEAYEQIKEDNNLEQPLLGNKQNNKPKADLNLHKPQAKGCCAALCAIFTGK